jgi:hypothetical protein
VRTVGPGLEAFLAQPLLAVVGTLRRNGAILLTPVWFEHRAGEVWLNSYASATWLPHEDRISLRLTVRSLRATVR